MYKCSTVYEKTTETLTSMTQSCCHFCLLLTSVTKDNLTALVIVVPEITPAFICWRIALGATFANAFDTRYCFDVASVVSVEAVVEIDFWNVKQSL